MITFKIMDKIKLWIANRLPKWLVYWATIRLLAHVTGNKYSDTLVPELTVMDALERWEKNNGYR